MSISCARSGIRSHHTMRFSVVVVPGTSTQPVCSRYVYRGIKGAVKTCCNARQRALSLRTLAPENHARLCDINSVRYRYLLYEGGRFDQGTTNDRRNVEQHCRPVLSRGSQVQCRKTAKNLSLESCGGGQFEINKRTQKYRKVAKSDHTA